MPAHTYLFILLLLVSLVDLNSQHLRFKRSSNLTKAVSSSNLNHSHAQYHQNTVRTGNDEQIGNPWEKNLECPPTPPKVQWNLAGIPGDGYYICAQIGTPPQSVNLLVDTGSSNLAVAGANEATLDTFFKPNHSSSFVILNNTLIKVAYTQGWWEGQLGSDVVVLPSLACHLQTRSFVALIRRSHSFYVAGSHWQGILGLAFPELAQPNKSVQPWFDSLLSAHNSTHQLVTQQQLLQEIVPNGYSTLEAPSTKLAHTSLQEIQLPTDVNKVGPSAIEGKSVVQTNESSSLSQEVVNKIKIVSNSSFRSLKRSQRYVLENFITIFNNDSLSFNENSTGESMESGFGRTKLLKYFNKSYSIDHTTIRNVDVLRPEEGLQNSRQNSFSIKNISSPESRQIFEVRTKQFSASPLDNNEVTTVESLVSHSTVTNTLDNTRSIPSQTRDTFLPTNLLYSELPLHKREGLDDRDPVPNIYNTSVLHNLPDVLPMPAVDASNRTDVPELADHFSVSHETSIDGAYAASRNTLVTPMADLTLINNATGQSLDNLADVSTGSGGGVLSNTFGMELCGHWSAPQHDSHHGRIMLGSLVDSCGDGPWFEAPILQPWFYEVAVTSMAVGGRTLDLPCTLYNTHASIVDSGTTKLKLPDTVLDAVVSALEAAVHQQLPEPLPDNFWRGEGQVCWTDAHTAWSVLPSLSIQVALSNYSSFSIELGPRSYLRPVPIGPASYSDDAVGIMAPLRKKSVSKHPTFSLPEKPDNTARHGDRMSTDIRTADEHSGSLETLHQEVVGPRNRTRRYHSSENISTSKIEKKGTFLSSKDHAEETRSDSLTRASDHHDISTDTNFVNAQPELPKALDAENVPSTRRKRSSEGVDALAGTINEDTQPTDAPPTASPAAVPCWTSGIEPSNMGTVLGVVVLEGLCTRFDRGRGLLGFRRGRCGPVVSLKGPIPHDGAGSCVPGGSGGAGTVVLGSLLAVLCCPLLVFAVRWLVLYFRRNAPRLRSTTYAPFLTLDEAPNMFNEQ